jgi:hypothetical protein
MQSHPEKANLLPNKVQFHAERTVLPFLQHRIDQRNAVVQLVDALVLCRVLEEGDDVQDL